MASRASSSPRIVQLQASGPTGKDSRIMDFILSGASGVSGVSGASKSVDREQWSRIRDQGSGIRDQKGRDRGTAKTGIRERGSEKQGPR
jgi:hypothetical protein